MYFTCIFTAFKTNCCCHILITLFGKVCVHGDKEPKDKKRKVMLLLGKVDILGKLDRGWTLLLVYAIMEEKTNHLCYQEK
jgi:hypothetical protein